MAIPDVCALFRPIGDQSREILDHDQFSFLSSAFQLATLSLVGESLLLTDPAAMSIVWNIPKPDIEGTVSWGPAERPDVTVKTWYRVNGDLNSGKTPIIAVHGGPGGFDQSPYIAHDSTCLAGCPHDYILNWTELIPTGHPIIFYE